MHELKDYSNKDVEKWLKQQEEYASPLLQRNKSDPCYRIGMSIIGCVDRLKHCLTGYVQAEHRRRQIRMALRDEWMKSHHGYRAPPQDVLHSMDEEAAKSAFCELYPELAHLAKEIADLRTQAETQFKCQG
ncbi:MAG TPA: hypothetical protein VF296_02930 [Gallionella sp.]